MDGFLLVLWASACCSWHSSTSSSTASSGRCCATCAPRRASPRIGPGGWSSWSRRAASRPPATRSVSTSSPPLGRDVNNAIVIDDPFASADHAVLTYRGRSWYLEDLGSTNGSYINGRRVEGVAPMGFGDELQIGQVRMRLERASRDERRWRRRGEHGRRRCPASLGPIRPRPRWLELRLLALVAVALAVGSLSLEATGQRQARSVRPRRASLIYVVALFAAHAAQVLAGRRTDQILLPTVGDARRDLAPAHAAAAAGPRDARRSSGRSSGWPRSSSSGCCWRSRVATTLGIVVRSDSWLRRYKYTWAAVGVGLLLLTFVFGTEINGQRLTLQLGPFSGQPTELLKVILVVFLAGYLSENRTLLWSRTRGSGRCACRRCRTSRRWSRCGRSRSASSSSSATWARRCSSSASSWRCSTSPPAGSAW